MEVYRDFCIYGGREQLDAAMKEIEQSLPKDWVRARDAESHMRSMGSALESVYCFRSTSIDFLPPATIFLMERTPGSLCISNIIPSNTDSLSYGEYNAIVEYFCEYIVGPAAKKHGLRVEMSDSQKDLGEYMSDMTERKLRLFLLMANKKTGSAHPADHGRWVDFITAAHKEGSKLDASTLRRWLGEVEKWPWETADQLAAEYEFSRELLTYYDRVGKGA